MKSFEVYYTKRGKTELEGVFDSLKEVALYLEAPKATVTLILNAEYRAVPKHLHHISIVEIFDQRSYGEDLVSFMADETPLAQ